MRHLYPPNRSDEGDQSLLEMACAHFLATTGMSIETTQHTDDGTADTLGTFKSKAANIPLVLEVKRQLNQSMVGAIAHRLKQHSKKGLLIADYINPAMADRLKALDVWFIDTAGNAYINQPPVFVYIKGNRPEQLLSKLPKMRAFQPTGLKIIFALLGNVELVNSSYREIAQAADVALGTVGWVMNDLKNLGHLVDMGIKKRRLKERKRLFERWVEAYPEQLRPKLVIGRFTSKAPEWWKHKDLEKLGAYMGGEIAAEYLTGYLKPELITLYLRGKPQNVQLAFKMRKDPNGEIELLKAFWPKTFDWHDHATVSPILVYADLLATADPRNLETAQILYEQKIARYLIED